MPLVDSNLLLLFSFSIATTALIEEFFCRHFSEPLAPQLGHEVRREISWVATVFLSHHASHDVILIKLKVVGTSLGERKVLVLAKELL